MKTVFTDSDAELGIETRVHQGDGKTVIEKTYDAQPFLEHAANMRAATEGQRWGEGRVVGTVPPAVVSMFLRQDGRLDAKRCAAWLKENPHMIWFDRFRQQ